MLAVQLAVNVFKNAAGKGVGEQVAQYIVFGIAVLRTLLPGGRAVCLSLIFPLILPVGPVCAGRCPGGLTRSGAASGCRCAT